MQLSVVLPGPVSDRLPEAAQESEKAGLYRLWTTESPGRDAVLRASVLLGATRTLAAGTGISFAFARQPLAAAGLAADAYELSGGRFSLGLGAGTRGQRRWYGVDFDHPAARMADYVRALRAIWAGDGRARYQGPFYDIDVPRVQLAGTPASRAGLKVYGGGLHPRMLRAVADSCDGVVLHPLAGGPRYLDDVVLPAIAAAPDRAPGFRLVVWCPLSVDFDAELARRRAAEQLAFYFATPSYRDVAGSAGYGAVADELVDRFNNGGAGFAELAPLIPDGMLDHFVVHGTPAQVADRLAARRTAWAERGVDEVALQIPAQSVTSDSLLDSIGQLAATVLPRFA
ncbi:LLM class flavin-dependent oxidoreductase [Actinacidiphila sp. ITFR-21]|uniref:LLM class flavin-dependent oxidoreductase n=1 Tax=Actinacidiphila sp. ITFR-21 TaxID=3075199 RepID=UPI00288A3622|nr:LLM class flavin-dependent oxidoreductase [Streptomyces sp. ITFR-21]WNI19012.1 LLM class flavin-dependent oxidoreductase [Streptomyces sp. ITFR-21]